MYCLFVLTTGPILDGCRLSFSVRECWWPVWGAGVLGCLFSGGAGWWAVWGVFSLLWCFVSQSFSLWGLLGGDNYAGALMRPRVILRALGKTVPCGYSFAINILGVGCVSGIMMWMFLSLFLLCQQLLVVKSVGRRCGVGPVVLGGRLFVGSLGVR